jgi:methionine-rich copper-binding protein CopC
MTQVTTRHRLALLAAIIVGALALGAPAAAHTELKQSTPAKGATVQELTEVTLVFTEKVRLAQVKVLTAGKELQNGGAQVTGDTVVQSVAPDAAPGAYTIAYRVVSADGHPIQGTVPFKIGPAAGGATSNPPADGAPADSTPASSTTSANGGERWLMVGAGLLAGMGIGVAIVFLRRGKAPSD